MKVTRYKNMTVGKLKNRRVLARVDDQNNMRLAFVLFTDKLSPRAIHETHKGKIVTTSFVISKESAMALYQCLGSELSRLIS